ncbi:PEP-CTERM sorting domain-containing protein [Paludisphaera borealis]|uniref:Ice-binding protein C-terminal domain-containing protein n=1 Tax=Paludisphaera borealis TaxID=1387353 RepID=A0A1U7CS02_9BACT|nr:PEP-CTERM sorting domain-containing protein [Paludisphaera borealis]APW61724.1 hypothetical protein BSF38_03252 [Paludisphaera borealis]
MTIHRPHLILTAILTMTLFMASTSNAGSITYTITTSGSGSLGGQAFDGEVVLRFVGDTANVVEPAPGVFYNSLGTATVTIAGLGTAVFTQPIAVYADHTYNSVGFIDGSDYTSGKATLGILNLLSPDYATYALSSAFGPVSGNGWTSFTVAGFATDRGAFILPPPGSGVFEAVTSAGAVPEPASLVMLGLGAGVLGCVVRRKARAAA